MGRKSTFCGIYKITCKANNKVYIGKSKNIFSRLSVHFGKFLKGEHPNKELTSDFEKYGLNGFAFEVLELLDDVSGSCANEDYFIRKHESHLPNKGYNISNRTKKQGRF